MSASTEPAVKGLHQLVRRDGRTLPREYTGIQILLRAAARSEKESLPIAFHVHAHAGFRSLCLRLGRLMMLAADGEE